jgi:hypothetical protein
MVSSQVGPKPADDIQEGQRTVSFRHDWARIRANLAGLEDALRGWEAE